MVPGFDAGLLALPLLVRGPQINANPHLLQRQVPWAFGSGELRNELLLIMNQC